MHEKRLTNDFFHSEMKTKVIKTCLVALVKSHNLNLISGLLHGQVHNVISWLSHNTIFCPNISSKLASYSFSWENLSCLVSTAQVCLGYIYSIKGKKTWNFFPPTSVVNFVIFQQQFGPNPTRLMYQIFKKLLLAHWFHQWDGIPVIISLQDTQSDNSRLAV